MSIKEFFACFAAIEMKHGLDTRSTDEANKEFRSLAKKFRDAATAKERERSARLARRVGRRLCPDTDSIQNRVGEEIAKTIEGKS